MDEEKKTAEKPTEEEDSDEFDKKYGPYILVCCLALLGVLFFWDRSSHPALIDYGIKNWATVCSGEGRIYRLRSENRHSQQTFSLSVKKRNLQFLDAEGKIRYFTNWFDYGSIDEASVWRFKRTGRGVAAWIYSKKAGLWAKADALLFPKDSERQKHWDEDRVLYGDESFFDISLQLDKLSIVREGNLPILVLPCEPDPVSSNN